MRIIPPSRKCRCSPYPELRRSSALPTPREEPQITTMLSQSPDGGGGNAVTSPLRKSTPIVLPALSFVSYAGTIARNRCLRLLQPGSELVLKYCTNSKAACSGVCASTGLSLQLLGPIAMKIVPVPPAFIVCTTNSKYALSLGANVRV